MKLCNLLFALSLSASLAAASGQTPLSPRTPAAASAPTAIPSLVPFTGTAVSSEGKPLAGEASMTFMIFKDEAGGEPLWTESQTAAVDSTGHYKVQLGAANPNGLPSDLFANGEARWLEIQIAGEAQQPRVLLASVPYALKAADATTLGGLPASAFALAGAKTASASGLEGPTITSNAASNVTTTGGTANTVAKFSGSNTIVNSILYDNGTEVGIGTTTPSATLTVDGTMTLNGASTLNGGVALPAQGTATASKSYSSQYIKMSTSAYNSSTKAVVAPRFQLMGEVTGNDTASPNGTLNLLASSGASAPAETGFYFNTNGTIHFAPGQTFPGGTGTGTITGVTAGTGLTGGGTSGNVTLKVAVPLVLSGDNATGVIQGVETGSGNGVYGQSATGFGVSGVGPSFGVAGTSSGNIGVYGSGPYAGVSSYGGFYGGLSKAYNATGEADGINTTGATGVFATSNRRGGTGVYAVADNGDGFDYGIWGVSNSGSAGVFSGNVDVIGTLTKSAGTFKIDDPLDPANKYLSHSFVESPDMKNIYDGVAALDANGEATVQLPEYFAALNKDYRYQLTAMGGPGPNLYIAEEIANNQFKIAGGKGGMKVSWQVTGIRQDAYANAHRTPVEAEKPGKEKGTYLYPELFGQPEEKGREWAVHPEIMKRAKQGREKEAITQADQ